jgi:hypothetical protein
VSASSITTPTGCLIVLLALALLTGESRAAEPADQTIDELVSRIRMLEARVRTLEARAAAPAAADPAEPEVAAEAPAGLDTDPREQERLVRAAFQRRLLERGGLLLAPGAVDVDMSLRYLNSSSDRIVIDGFTILPVLVVGDIVSERVRHDFVEAAATARLGLPWNLQAALRVPAAYQQRRVTTAEREEESEYDFDLGDIELELSHQLHRSRGRWPDLLASLRWKTDTGANPLNASPGELSLGTGYDALGASLTAVSVADPAVFFGGVSYSRNFSADSDRGRYRPGDSYGFDVGLALALNLATSLSFAYEHRFTEPSALDGQELPGSRLSTGIFTVGGSYSATPTTTVDVSVGIGVTEDAPDLMLQTSFPLYTRF